MKYNQNLNLINKMDKFITVGGQLQFQKIMGLEESSIFGNEFRRLSYTTSLNVMECKQCFQLGKQSCWDAQPSLTGDMSKSYCCGPNDAKCSGLTYCSDRVTDSNLKLMSCPIDTLKCPVGNEAIIKIGNAQPQNIRKSWKNFEIRQNSVCKLKIDYSNFYNSTMTNHKLHINIDSLLQTDAFFIQIPEHGQFNSNSKAYTLLQGNQNTYNLANSNMEHWVIFSPDNYKAGEISITAWVTQQAVEAVEEKKEEVPEEKKEEVSVPVVEEKKVPEVPVPVKPETPAVEEKETLIETTPTAIVVEPEVEVLEQPEEPKPTPTPIKPSPPPTPEPEPAPPPKEPEPTLPPQKTEPILPPQEPQPTEPSKEPKPTPPTQPEPSSSPTPLPNFSTSNSTTVDLVTPEPVIVRDTSFIGNNILYIVLGLVVLLSSLMTFMIIYFCCRKKLEDEDELVSQLGESGEIDLEELKKMHDKMLGHTGSQNNLDAQEAETMLIEIDQLTARSMQQNMAQQRKLNSILQKKKLDQLKKTYKLDQNINEDEEEKSENRLSNSLKQTKSKDLDSRTFPTEIAKKRDIINLQRPPSNASSFNPFEPIAIRPGTTEQLTQSLPRGSRRLPTTTAQRNQMPSSVGSSSIMPQNRVIVHPDDLPSGSSNNSEEDEGDENATDKKLKDQMTLQSDAFSQIGGLRVPRKSHVQEEDSIAESEHPLVQINDDETDLQLGSIQNSGNKRLKRIKQQIEASEKADSELGSQKSGRVSDQMPKVQLIKGQFQPEQNARNSTQPEILESPEVRAIKANRTEIKKKTIQQAEEGVQSASPQIGKHKNNAQSSQNSQSLEISSPDVPMTKTPNYNQIQVDSQNSMENSAIAANESPNVKAFNQSENTDLKIKMVQIQQEEGNEDSISIDSSGKKKEARKKKTKERIGSATSRYLSQKGGGHEHVILETEESQQSSPDQEAKKRRSKEKKDITFQDGNRDSPPFLKAAQEDDPVPFNVANDENLRGATQDELSPFFSPVQLKQMQKEVNRMEKNSSAVHNKSKSQDMDQKLETPLTLHKGKSMVPQDKALASEETEFAKMVEEQLSSSGAVEKILGRSPSPNKKITMVGERNAHDDVVRVVSFAGATPADAARDLGIGVPDTHFSHFTVNNTSKIFGHEAQTPMLGMNRQDTQDDQLTKALLESDQDGKSVILENSQENNDDKSSFLGDKSGRSISSRMTSSKNVMSQSIRRMYTADIKEVGKSFEVPTPELALVEMDIKHVQKENETAVNRMMKTLGRFWQDSVIRKKIAQKEQQEAIELEYRERKLAAQHSIKMKKLADNFSRLSIKPQKSTRKSKVEPNAAQIKEQMEKDIKGKYDEMIQKQIEQSKRNSVVKAELVKEMSVPKQIPKAQVANIGSNMVKRLLEIDIKNKMDKVKKKESLKKKFTRKGTIKEAENQNESHDFEKNIISHSSLKTDSQMQSKLKLEPVENDNNASITENKPNDENEDDVDTSPEISQGPILQNNESKKIQSQALSSIEEDNQDKSNYTQTYDNRTRDDAQNDGSKLPRTPANGKFQIKQTDFNQEHKIGRPQTQEGGSNDNVRKKSFKAARIQNRLKQGLDEQQDNIQVQKQLEKFTNEYGLEPPVKSTVNRNANEINIVPSIIGGSNTSPSLEAGSQINQQIEPEQSEYN